MPTLAEKEKGRSSERQFWQLANGYVQNGGLCSVMTTDDDEVGLLTYAKLNERLSHLTRG